MFSLLFIFLWNRKQWLNKFMFIITLECSKLWIWMGIYFRDILLIRMSRGGNICVQCVFEKNIYFVMISPPILNSYPMKVKILVIFLNKRSKGLTMQINFNRLLWSYLLRVPIFLAMTVRLESMKLAMSEHQSVSQIQSKTQTIATCYDKDI